ncbi:MAG TPA: anti-sigma factor [Xanthobacteraceae bacterium]|nr:anti-sigma factor [Xanthobacteraceae bacterium]
MTLEAEPDDREGRAAEYVLGTLDAEERLQAQALMAADSRFAEMVRAWERRLGELSALIASVEPPPHTWDRIKGALVASVPAAEPSRVAPASARAASDRAVMVDLRRRMRWWRGATAALTAIAATLAGVVVVRELWPEILPEQLRPKAQVVEVTKTVPVPSPKPAQYVAVLQRDAASPAFLLTFDLDNRVLTVRTVGAAQQPGKSYELWMISPNDPRPRSLGVIGTEEFSVRRQLAAYDAVTINSATYAVSIEPVGGSPTGLPTGPVVYTGKLIQTTPPGFGSQSP